MNTPQLPFSRAPIDWREPVEIQPEGESLVDQLRQAITTAERHGFRPFRLTVIERGYRIEFVRRSRIPARGHVPVEDFRFSQYENSSR